LISEITDKLALARCQQHRAEQAYPPSRANLKRSDAIAALVRSVPAVVR
jgi:hypothetical protein